MRWMGYIIIVVAAILAAVKAFISKPQSSGRRFAWILGLLIAIGGALTAILVFPQEQRTKNDVKDATRQAMAEKNCTLDSLERLNSIFIKEIKTFRQLRRDYAICFSQIAKTEFEKAQVAMGLGEYDSALFLLGRILVVNKGDSASLASTFFYRAGCHYFKKEFDSALWSLDSALAHKHDDPDAWYNMGITFGCLYRYEEALHSFDSALVYKHDDAADTWYDRGLALINLRRYDEALHSFDKALAYKRDFADAWLNRGFILYDLGRHEEALQSYDSTLVYKHDDAYAWHNRGGTLDRLGRSKEALQSYDSALVYKHDYFAAWHERGVTLDELGRSKEALQSYDSALYYKHDYSFAWYSRGLILSKLGRRGEAMASCDSALKYGPDRSDIASFRNWLLQQMKDQP